MNKLMMIPLLGLLSAGTALAQEPAAAPTASEVEAQKQDWQEQRLEHLSAKLGLSPQQKDQVGQTFARFRTQREPVFQDMKQTREQLKAELDGGRNPQRISTLTERLSSDRRQLQTLHESEQRELKAQLTPEQYAKLLVSGPHGHGRRGHFGRHGHFPRGE